MEERLIPLIEQLDRDEPSVREGKLIFIAQPLMIVSGYVHARDALRKLANLDFNPDYLETTQQFGNEGFPGIYALRILDNEKIWHEHHNDQRFRTDIKDSLNIISALHPMNAWCHADGYYGAIARRNTELESEVTNGFEFLQKQRLSCNEYLQKTFWSQARQKNLNDCSRRYLDDESFLKAGIHTGRLAMEGIFANYQASIDTRNICREVDLCLWEGEPSVSGIFLTEMIRVVYGPIVSQPVPGEDKPYNFRYIDREFLSSIKS